MFLGSRIGKYLFSQLLSGYAMTLGVILLAIALVDVVEQMRGIGKHVHLPILDALGLTLLKTPSLIDDTLPFIVLVGTMIAFIRMNRRGELAAMRAAGLSAWRFTSPALIFAACLGLFATLLLNPIGVRLLEAYDAKKLSLKNEGAVAPPTLERIWLRQPEDDGQIIITGMPATDGGPNLERPTFFLFQRETGKPLRFIKRLDASIAELSERRWKLKDVVENAPGFPRASFSELVLPTMVEPSTLLGRFAKPEAMSFWKLPGVIIGLKRAGFTPQKYEFQLHKMLAKPVLFSAMAAIACAFCLRLARGGGLVADGARAVGFGILLFFFMTLAGAFAIAEAASALLAGWVPPISGLAAALVTLSLREDG